MRPLSPGSQSQYARILERAKALGGIQEARAWKPSQQTLLRSALIREAVALGEDEAAAVKRIDGVLPRVWCARKRPVIPDETAARRYDLEASKLPPDKRALALLPIALGLRAAEVCNLTRAAIETALSSGELVVMGKGGRERVLPAKALSALFDEILKVPAASGRFRLCSPTPTAKPWERLGEVLSPGLRNDKAMLRTLVKDVGRRARVNVHPHSLRHAFASRMNRDGAPLATIQAALGHASIAMTAWYVHPTTADIGKYVRPVDAPAAPITTPKE